MNTCLIRVHGIRVNTRNTRPRTLVLSGKNFSSIRRSSGKRAGVSCAREIVHRINRVRRRQTFNILTRKQQIICKRIVLSCGLTLNYQAYSGGVSAITVCSGNLK